MTNVASRIVVRGQQVTHTNVPSEFHKVPPGRHDSPVNGARVRRGVVGVHHHKADALVPAETQHTRTHRRRRNRASSSSNNNKQQQQQQQQQQTTTSKPSTHRPAARRTAATSAAVTPSCSQVDATPTTADVSSDSCCVSAGRNSSSVSQYGNVTANCPGGNSCCTLMLHLLLLLLLWLLLALQLLLVLLLLLPSTTGTASLFGRRLNQRGRVRSGSSAVPCSWCTQKHEHKKIHARTSTCAQRTMQQPPKAPTNNTASYTLQLRCASVHGSIAHGGKQSRAQSSDQQRRERRCGGNASAAQRERGLGAPRHVTSWRTSRSGLHGLDKMPRSVR